MTEIAKYKQGDEITSIEVFKPQEITFYGREINSEIKLSNLENKFLEVINYPIISKMEYNDLLESIFIIVSNNLRALSSNMDADDQLLLVNDFNSEVVKYFPNLTIKEIEEIMNDGLRSKLDPVGRETIGLSVINFNIWAKKYLEIKNKNNLELQKKLDRLMIPESLPKQITEESIITMLRNEFILSTELYSKKPKQYQETVPFDNYWRAKGIPVSSNYIYEQLLKYKLVTPRQLNSEIKKLQPKEGEESSLLNVTIRMEAERMVCCNYAIKLRNKKLKDEKGGSKK